MLCIQLFIFFAFEKRNKNELVCECLCVVCRMSQICTSYVVTVKKKKKMP